MVFEVGNQLGYRHGMTGHPFHTCWNNMRHRCSNSNRPDYQYYGGRGIKVCDRWMVFENFRDDMFDGWAQGLSIERIQSDGDYEPGNCRWASHSDQMKNKRYPPRSKESRMKQSTTLTGRKRPEHSEAMKRSWARRKVAYNSSY